MMYPRLPLSFYQDPDVVQIAKNLLGKVLLTHIGQKGITGGIIVETEAYAGAIDRASHAFGNRKTARTQVMYSAAGVSYVYLIYGVYNLFNIITNAENIPHAVLIRAIEPVEGIETMLERRKMSRPERKLTAGPGLLSQALGITREQNGLPLNKDIIWLEDRGIQYKEQDIIASPRVGVGYAGEDALLPYRFRVKNSMWTSKAR